MRQIRALITARYPIVLYGIRSILLEENDFAVIATCKDIPTTIRAVRNLSPDVAIVHESIPTAGFGILRMRLSEDASTRVLFLASSAFDPSISSATRKGTFGVISAEASPQELVQSLRHVAAGAMPSNYVDNDQTGSQRHAIYDALTGREREIAHLVSHGLSNKEIARLLDLSEGTIKAHLHNMFHKLAIANRTVLANLATKLPPAKLNDLQAVSGELTAGQASRTRAS